MATMEEVREKFKSYGGFATCDMPLEMVRDICDGKKTVARVEPGVFGIICTAGVKAIRHNAIYFLDDHKAENALKSLNHEERHTWLTKI